ncbi:MAG: DUF2207 domain-containing protein [Actinomycetota bacterium]|nr:DUF2207 domain-containing protein [Actinomycetota bacterium]
MTSRAGAVWAVLLATALMVLFPATAQAASGDVMTSVDVAITLDEQGGATFRETIDYDFGPGTHHGIYREVVTRQAVSAAQGQDAQAADRYRYYALGDVTASSPTGAASDVELIDHGLSTQMRIGDPGTFVEGSQTYVLSYHLANVMNPFPDHVEFFYNVFKDDTVPKDRLSITVNGPGGVTQVRCARGGSGTDTTGDGSPCDAATPGSPASFLLTGVRSNEDVTIATQLPTGGFGTLTPDVRTGTSGYSQSQSRVLSSLALGGGLLVPLLAAGGMAVLVATRGRDERYAGLTPGLTPGPTDAPGSVRVVRGGAPVVAVQFTPPAGVQPGMVGTLIDESADTVDVSATVIDLAVRGYLRIEETQGSGMFKRTDWSLTRLEPDPSQPPLRAWESTVLEGIFEDSNPVQLSALKTHFATTLAAAKTQMYDDVVQRGWFRRSPRGQRAGWQGLGFLLIGAGVASAVWLGGATSDIDRTGGISIGIPSGMVLGIGLLVAGLIVRVLGSRMAARTAQGSAVNAQALGFKRYLETAEAGQIRFEEAQSIFSRYLPYAIVFGVADRWAGTFAQVAEAAEAAGQPLVMPTWYLYAGMGFPDFGSIADGAGSFATTAGGTFAASATTGGSGGSGFGGGGFSGGGGGGSSSGSW